MSSDYSYLSNAEPDYIDNLYKDYQEDPESVEYGWQKFFEGFDFALKSGKVAPPSEDVRKEISVLNLIHAYRIRGHLFTKTNPVRERRKYSPTLDLHNFQLSEADLKTVFQAGEEIGIGPASLEAIIEHLEATYCHSIGVEFMYARSPEIVEWLRERMESSRNTQEFTLEQRKHILHKLNQAVAFETFLGSKYVGEKRFSLEGAESLIPALDGVIERGAELGIDEFVLGMAHRGRLNVLANILGKTYNEIFSEFEGIFEPGEAFDGDVKYHLGFSTDVTTDKGKSIHLAIMPNPSHLESVAPIAQGNVRAKIDKKYDRDHNRVATILIHGDAAIAGQGVVYEVVQMSELEANETGGTIHITINNQVGFTTNYIEGRSSVYCTDVAKVTQSPVFHVNGDDAEAVFYVTQLAMEFRQRFHKDVFIDLLCYRRHGHNEGDEPRFTQPTLYKLIEKHSDPREIYFQKLLNMGKVEASLAREMEKKFKRFLQERLNEVKENPKSIPVNYDESRWKNFIEPKASDWEKHAKTAISEKKFRDLAKKISSLPDDMTFYDKIVRIMEGRRKMLEEDRLDWAMGELLAYATLLDEGHDVRLSGQDVERGTFAHRHAVLKINGGEEEYVPLNHLSKKQARFEIFNSLLSEYAVLGFEYGFSWAAPESLTIWEAQFGDFVNGAQIVIDQYITSAFTKWKRMSGLVLLLPHGWEGQGPEHSSARLERFMELCAGNNIQVANPTTPANMFHLLRRQIQRNFRAPLFVMTPKSLLRHPKVVSGMNEFTDSGFRRVIDDPYVKNPKSVKKVFFCSGKIYYDIQNRQEEEKRQDLAIIRMEQLYPLPHKDIEEILKKYQSASSWYWVQEEPENMGAWPFMLRKFTDVPLEVISRKENSSPATGYKKQHLSQQKYILDRVFEAKAESKSGKKKELVKK